MSTRISIAAVAVQAETAGTKPVVATDREDERAACMHSLIDSITAIVAAAEANRQLLTRGDPSPEDLLGMLDLIVAEGERAAALVGTLRGMPPEPPPGFVAAPVSVT
jgi:hypothetical protein